MVLTSILYDSAKRFSKKPAVTMRMGYRTVSLSYEQVLEISKKIVSFLAAQGLKKGDSVIIWAPNSPYWICVLWACLLGGFAVVPLSIQMTQAVIDSIVKQTQARFMFIASHTGRVPSSHKASTCQGGRACTIFVLDDIMQLIASYAPATELPTIVDGDCAEIMYTSGTTGDPKGVVLTHHAIASDVLAAQSVFNVHVVERFLSVLPLSHMFEQSAGFFVPFSIGAHIIYAHSHGAIKELARKYRVTTIVAVPEFLKVMASGVRAAFEQKGRVKWLDRLQSLSEKIPFKPLQKLLWLPVHRSLGGHLKTLASGGAPLDPALEIFWNNCGFYVLQGYGLTETAPIIALNTYNCRRYGSVGKPLPGVLVRCSESGEIEVSGPIVFSGYLNDDEKTQQAMTPDGWFKTGDMGFIDADGFLFLKGRKKYMIKGPGAQNIYPEDIEAVINVQPGVKDCCVVGLEKHAGMLEIHAVLLLDEQAHEPENIIHSANNQLASYQHVTGWSVWPEGDFPRSVTRKVKKEHVLTWLKTQADQKQSIPQTRYAHPLGALISEVCGVDQKSLQSTTRLVVDLKLDSLMRIMLIARIEETFGILIDERMITAQTTVQDLEQLLLVTQPIKKVPRAKRWVRSAVAQFMRFIGRGLLRLFIAPFVTIRVVGAEHITAAQKPFVIMPNHVSLIDGLFIMLALARCGVTKTSFAAAYDVLYQEYWYVAWLAELFFNTFPFPRQEHEHIATGLLNMGTLLDAGYSVVVFPEGRVSEDGKLQPLKRGSGLVAVEMGCPVIPVKLSGVEKIIPFGCHFPRSRGTITVTIGPALTFKKSMAYDEATQAIFQKLGDL